MNTINKPASTSSVSFSGPNTLPVNQTLNQRTLPSDKLEIRFSGAKEVNQDVVDQALAEACQSFGHKLSGAMAERMSKETAVFSPASVWNLLMVVLNGAQADTRTELLDVMGLDQIVSEGATLEQLNAAQTKVDTVLGDLPDVTLESAYGVWNQAGRPFNPEFLNRMETLNAATGELTPGDASPINNWCNEKTRGMIPSILKNEDIKEDTNAVLGNALYLKASWTNKFDSDKTKNETFKGINGETKVPLMTMNRSDKVKLNYTETDDYQALKLPYGEAIAGYQQEGPKNQLTMTVILPKEGKNLTDLMENLNDQEFRQKLTQSLRGQKSDVDLLKLPKFRAEYKVEDLVDILKELGLEKVFDADLSNLRDMMKDEQSFISKMLQKAIIDVSEEGTEAAAVTVALVMRATSVMEPPKPIKMEADRPFAYIISDEATQKPLFIGTVTDLDAEKNKSESNWD